MCIYNKKLTKLKEAVIYKIFTNEDNNIVSSYSGCPIRIGKVPILIKTKSIIGLLDEKTGLMTNIEDHKGLSMGYVDIEDAISRSEKSFGIVKVILSGRIYSGISNNCEIYAGSNIKDIEIIRKATHQSTHTFDWEPYFKTPKP